MLRFLQEGLTALPKDRLNEGLLRENPAVRIAEGHPALDRRNRH
jgi:hypothetical protein